MFNYNISPKVDNKAFKTVCDKIERNLVAYSKEPPLVDVDGSILQIYNTKDGKIKVNNDYLVDAVYIESTVDLTNII